MFVPQINTRGRGGLTGFFKVTDWLWGQSHPVSRCGGGGVLASRLWSFFPNKTDSFGFSQIHKG